MLAYCLATLRTAPRVVWIWLLAVSGTAVCWFTARASIFSFGDSEGRAPTVCAATAGAVGALAAIGLTSGGLETDARSGFTAAADASGPGFRGRMLGRWSGATLGGVLAMLLVLALSWPALETGQSFSLYLLLTSIVTVCLAAAWALLIGGVWGGSVGMVAGALAWSLGFLPWGQAGFLVGTPGRVARALLPTPTWPEHATLWWVVKALALAGLLLLALRLARPVVRHE